MNAAILELEPMTPIAMPPKGLVNRVGSIDAFRVFVMLLMLTEALDIPDVASNLPDSRFWSFLNHELSHSSWIGCSLFDLIQPGFSFLVGVALPYSLARRATSGARSFRRRRRPTALPRRR